MRGRVVAVWVGLTLPAAAVAQTGGPVEVPLRWVEDRLVVEVTGPGDTPLEFIVSTGNGVTVFSERGVARAGGENASLTLAGVPVVTDRAVTIPDDRLTVGGRVLDGIVGSNTLNQYDVLIDPAHDRMVLKPIGPTVDWPGVALSDPVRMRVFHGLILSMDVTLGGRDYGAMLDTGSPSVIVSSPVQDALGLEPEDISTLRLGNSSLSVPVRVEDLDIFARWDPDGNGFIVVGGAIAKDCAISLSWVHRELRTCVR